MNQHQGALSVLGAVAAMGAFGDMPVATAPPRDPWGRTRRDRSNDPRPSRKGKRRSDRRRMQKESRKRNRRG